MENQDLMKMDEDTTASDDHSRKTQTKIEEKNEAENLKQEIKVCVDIQIKVNELKKNIADKTYKIA